ncbi:MAG: amidohydrolase family protein [Verrucomicrobiales bacterium]|nr:amidohydrolase family protein [Verrucomicrobiales bacterium]
MNRRQFTKATGLGILGSGVACAATTGDEEIIDIHQHVNFSGRRNDDFLAHQITMGISKTVLLPSGSALSLESTHLGKSNGLAARVFGTMASARLAKSHPDSFAFFCNEIPDAEGAISKLEKWLENGAVGIGESKFHLECDSAPMKRIYDVAKAYEVPVLLHFEHDRYNMGFERFHRVLEAYPTVNFIGHAQTWWGNIDANHDQTEMYPKTRVKAGGLTDRYLSDYPNIYGDLSAGSGRNALNRDEDHASDFLERHQSKLLLGTDCSDAVGNGAKCSGSLQIENVRRLLHDPAARTKIFSGNAKKAIQLG